MARQAYHPHTTTTTTSTVSSLSSSSFRLLRPALLLAAIVLFTAHAHAQPYSERKSDRLVSGEALRQVLSERGFDEAQVEDILYEVEGHMVSNALEASYDSSQILAKRAGWKRIPVQTRFAPFGTKLIPSRSRGETSGPTLLRYGRSA